MMLGWNSLHFCEFVYEAKGFMVVLSFYLTFFHCSSYKLSVQACDQFHSALGKLSIVFIPI